MSNNEVSSVIWQRHEAERSYSCTAADFENVLQDTGILRVHAEHITSMSAPHSGSGA